MINYIVVLIQYQGRDMFKRGRSLWLQQKLTKQTMKLDLCGIKLQKILVSSSCFIFFQ
uniref:Uncharacterized protein n=1 Tax=Brassica oleracea TaxID=3712 RepID=A0A3P6BXD2_BRAOL|nr:unnamed protein product [Brassica oleracea]